MGSREMSSKMVVVVVGPSLIEIEEDCLEKQKIKKKKRKMIVDIRFSWLS